MPKMLLSPAIWHYLNKVICMWEKAWPIYWAERMRSSMTNLIWIKVQIWSYFIFLNGGFKKVYNFYHLTNATTFTWKIASNKKMFSQYRCHSDESHINFRLKSVQLFKRSQLFSEIQNKMVED